MALTLAIIIPVGGKHGSCVGEAVASIAAGTEQPDEVIVVEDHPTVPPPPSIQTIQLPEHKHGRSAARNFGIWKAKSDYVFFLDADDLLEPNAVALVRERMGPPLIRPIIRPREAYAGNGRLRVSFSTLEELRESLHTRKLPRFGITMAVDRRLVLSIGGFDQALTWCEDGDLLMRLAVLKPPIEEAVIEEPLVRVRTWLSTDIGASLERDGKPFKDRWRTGYYLK